MCRIWPTWQELDALRTPLTIGERALARFLDDSLPNTWSIYVQPYINDMRPDVVVRNPHHGIVVFEVKDWSLARYRFEGNQLIARTPYDSWVEGDPVRKVLYYARSMYEQFLVSDEATLDPGVSPNDLVLCRAAVYFHGSASDQALQLYQGRQGRVTVFGSDGLAADQLENLVPRFWCASANYLREEQVDALERAHAWLVPPKHALAQQQPSYLTSGQAEYAKPESGFRRVRGVAGAGKSFVLSHRAARANREGRNVLLLSFNITMSHVLRDLLKRAPFEVDWERVTWGHFHEWAKKQVIEAGLEVTRASQEEDTYFEPGSDRSEMLTIALERIVTKKEDLARGYRQPLYGGIYIDEGQDFDPRWLDSLAGFLADDGELVLFADHKQNVYNQDGGRDTRRTMRRCRFRGRWAQLPQKSHRLPWRIAMFLNEFAEQANLGDEEDNLIQDYADRPIQGDLAFDVMGWRNVTTVREGIGALDDALACLGDPNPGDVVVLLTSHALGLQAVQQLRPNYHQIVHIFDEGGASSSESRRRKVAFWMGRGGLKMCTIHSFKGWELDNVILVWPSDEDMAPLSPTQRASLFYTGVSRGMRNLVVLNANRGYDQYARDWDTVPVRSVSGLGDE